MTIPQLSVTPVGGNASIPISKKVVVYTPYERKGVIVMAAAGVTSCVFVSVLLLCINLTAVFPWAKRKPESSPRFTSRQIAVFIICLLVSDLIQSISGIIQVKWAMENQIYEGRACTIQAATLIFGDLGSTVWSCVIAAHTFWGLALRKQWPRWVVYVIVVSGWSFSLLLTVVPSIRENSKGPFFSIAGTWCFISSEYALARFGVHYIPLFAATLILFVFYGLVFLVLRGTIAFRGRAVRPISVCDDDPFLRERVVIAKRMLWYPFAYLLCIFPIAIIRVIGLRKEDVPESVWIFAMFFLFLLGAVDSVVYATTRKLIKLKSPSHMRTPGDYPYNGTKGDIIVLRNHNTVKKSCAYTGGSTIVTKMAGLYDEDLDYPDKMGESELFKDQSAIIHVTREKVEQVI